jgi:hypothetical protein
MALTAFTSRLGRGQGRLATPKATGGDYAFVLGDAEPGRVFELAPGDHAEVTQQADLTGVMLVRALLRLRVPASTPPGLAWEASILVDGTKLAACAPSPAASASSPTLPPTSRSSRACTPSACGSSW